MKISTKNSVPNNTRTNTESTDLLARLMASEDITVQHSADAHTAMMDVENRVLTLPVWEEMSGSLYDMLVMHEVGHALFTPANGWSDCAAIDSNEKNWPIVQMFYNIVEDARIERLMQDKFPGGRADFRAAYDNLHNVRDLFEIQDKDIDTLGLADRINIHFKLGTLGFVSVNFTSEEMVFVDAINAATTWDDVTEATRALYEYCKEQDRQNPQTAEENPMPEMQDMPEDGESTPQAPMVPAFDHGDNDENEDESTNGMPSASDEDGDEDGESGSTGETGEGEDSEESDDDTNGAGDNGEDSGESMEDDTDDGESAESAEGESTKGDAPAPQSTEGGESGSRNMSREIPSTVEAQNRNMDELRDKSGRDFNYFGTPEVSDKMVIDYSEIHIDNATFIKKYGTGTGFYNGSMNIDAAFANFINKNKKTVNKMAQQFEMKKAADQFKRTRISKSGRLDTNKMVNYRWSDDIFAKNETITDGKNHGLVMYVDWSGSMSGNMKSTIEQMLCLVLFCKKVNIPFEVYSFTSVNPNENDEDRWGSRKDSCIKFGRDEDYYGPQACWLNNYMSSRMKKTEYVNAMKNMLVLAEGMDCYGRMGRHDLGGTPLNECILAARDIMLDFKGRNNVQIAHTVFLTDGEACGDFLHGYNTTTIWKERKHGWSYTSEGRHRGGCTEVVLDWYKTTTGSRVVNFFITQTMNRHMQWTYFPEDIDGTEFKTAKKTFSKENMVSVGERGGYDETFLIKSNIETTNETGLENIDTDATAARLKNAFIKGQNARLASRALMNRFTDLIAD